MKDIAAGIIIISFIVSVIVFLIFVNRDNGFWETIKSPITGICYEMHSTPVMLIYSDTMSPIPDKYCEGVKND